MKPKITEKDHDHICDLVQNEFKKRGFKTIDHFEYNKNHIIGEIDVFAYKEGYTRGILVEVKYTNNYPNKKKAEKQTERAVKYCDFLQQFKNITKFYVYHNKDTYQIVKLR